MASFSGGFLLDGNSSKDGSGERGDREKERGKLSGGLPSPSPKTAAVSGPTQATHPSPRRFALDDMRPKNMQSAAAVLSVVDSLSASGPGPSSGLGPGPGPGLGFGTPREEKREREVKGLDMSGYRIQQLTPSICRFTQLTELRLANNQLSRLPSEIERLRALAFLDVSQNRLVELPRSIGWLTGLRELLLYENQLEELPSTMGYLYQLENLGVEGNPLHESLQHVMLAQGPLAIISFLRDHILCTCFLLRWSLSL